MKNLAFYAAIGLITLQSCTSPSETKTDEKVSGNEPVEIDYLALGKDYALQTKSILGKNLTQALGEGGPEYAMSFCNTKAIPLTDSMAVALNAKIKRVSDKPRNGNNQANEQELAFIETLKANATKGEKPKSSLQEMNGKMVGYYPIITNGMCLQCHGNKQSDLTPGTINKLAKLYPNDQATGYGDNQLRGLFVVEMDKK